MHIKFIKRGKGSASDAENYLLQQHDHKGEVRVDVQVLRGNPSLVSELANSLTFEHRYTSGVIAWHKDDAPTDAQIDQVLDDFERVAFAGLKGNQFAYYAVLHVENDGSKHVHVVAPRVELTTGKSMNIAPPNWQKTYDVLVDKYNTKHNWASPKDLHRRKLVNNSVNVYSDLGHTKAKTEINKAVQELVEHGTISNAEQVESYLNSVAGIEVLPRKGKKTLSLKVEGIEKNIKLEGLAYERGFSSQQVVRELEAEQEQRASASEADRSREYERVSGVFENIIKSRATFNQERYQNDARRDARIDAEEQRDNQAVEREQHQISERDRESISEESEEHKRQKNIHSLGDERSSSYGGSSRSMGLDSVHIEQNKETRYSESRDKNIRSTREQKLGDSVQRRDSFEPEHFSECGHVERGKNNSVYKGELDDSIRERIKQNAETTRRSFQARDDNYLEALYREVEQNSYIIQRADNRCYISNEKAGVNNRKIRERVREHTRRNRENAEQYREHKQRFKLLFVEQTEERIRDHIRETNGRIASIGAKIGRLKPRVKRQERQESIVKIRQSKHRKPKPKDYEGLSPS